MLSCILVPVKASESKKPETAATDRKSKQQAEAPSDSFYEEVRREGRSRGQGGTRRARSEGGPRARFQELRKKSMYDAHVGGSL